MRKLAILWVEVIVFGLCMAVSLALNVYAQQAGIKNNRMMAERRSLEQRRYVLQQKIQSDWQQKRQLHHIIQGGSNNRMNNLHPPRIINRNLFNRNF